MHSQLQRCTFTHIQQGQVKAQRHPVMRVTGDDKAIVHEQEVVAEGAVAQQQRLTSRDLGT